VKPYYPTQDGFHKLSRYDKLIPNMKFRHSVFLVLILLVASGYGLYLTSSNTDSTNLETITLTRQPLSVYVTATGIIKSESEYVVSSLETAKIDKVYVSNGDRVKKGAILVKFDDIKKKDQLTQAKLNLDSAILQRKLSTHKATLERDLAQTKEDIARSELNMIQNQYDKFNLHAKINGSVVQLNANQGDVNVAGRQLMRIIDTQHLYAKVEIDELDASRILPKQRAIVTFDGLPDQTFYFKVTNIADFTTHRNNRVVVEVRLDYDTFPKGLRIGNQVDVDIIIDERDDVPVLPIFATNRQKDGTQFVWVRGENGIEKKHVKLGLRDTTYVEVVSGISTSDIVVINQ